LHGRAEREPSWIAATALAAAAALLAFLVRRRAVAFASALLIATAAIGFAVSSLKAALIVHPVLDRPAYGVTVTGFIELREERERSDRIVVNVVDIDGERLDTPLERVRLSVRRGTAPAVGSYVTLKARLNPPLPPLRPGGYDFARDLYFQRIGAIGFVTGAIKVEAPPSQPSFRVRLLSLIDGMRDGIDRHIRAVVPGDAGSIASALITGKRDALSAPVNDAMYVSGLAHVLSISGYHMAVVAGVVCSSCCALGSRSYPAWRCAIRSRNGARCRRWSQPRFIWFCRARKLLRNVLSS
jgi:competence protein ComEC